jgi:hypothetical protein
VSEGRDKKRVRIPTKPRAEAWVAQGREKSMTTEQKIPCSRGSGREG